MKRTIMVLLLCTGLLLMTSAVWANVEKGKELQALISDADVSPYAGPVAYPQVDDQWDLVFWFDAGGLTSDNQLLGGEFAGGQFYVTSGAGTDPNVVYMFDASGALVGQFDQWSSPGWGWRDLCWDGSCLYGSDDTVVDAFDLAGNPVPGNNITQACNPARALAYDPVLDHFWTASFSTPIYEFDRTGATVWSGASGLAGVYGMAWDAGAPDGPWLWIFDQSGTPQTSIHQFNPITHSMTGFSYQLPLLPTSTDQLAGGLFMTEEWDPSLWCLGGVTQGTPNDMVFVLEMYIAANMYAPAAPDNLTVTPDAGGALTCDLAWDLPTLTVGGDPIASYPITSVEIERDGSPLASLAATATSYTDNVPSADMYNYTVYCVNDSGNGIPASGSAWVGPDTPGAVSNFTITPVGEELEADLAWDNPTVGAHGGYFQQSSITGYTIERFGPDPETIELTAGVQTSYTDNSMSVQGWYNYEIRANNASGGGTVAGAGPTFIGPPEFLPWPYNWVEINPGAPGGLPGTNTGITGDDQNLGPFPMGIDFRWYDNTIQNAIRVCSNGFLSFTSTSTTWSNVAIPNTAEPNNLVAPYFDDFYPPGGGSIWYYYDSANNRFIVEFYQVPLLSGGGSYTFEAIFYPTGDIDYMYKELIPGTPNSCTVGIENGTGTVGVQCTYNGSGPLEPAPLTGIRIFSVNPQVVPDVTIDMVATGATQFPYATGGTLEFDVTLTNNEAAPQLANLWFMYGPRVVGGPYSGTLPVGPVTVGLEQAVPPARLPVGTGYEYVGKVGDYPGTVWDQASILFDIVADGGGDVAGSDWECRIVSGWFDDPTLQTVNVVEEFALNGLYPNPFNPTTTINYALPEAAKVTLNVYDVSGRLVAEVVNGWRDAGVHEAVFNGSDLASGVYVFTLRAGDFNTTGKMVLMK